MAAKVFYSWQSQLPNSTTKGFIGDALERAIKAAGKDATIDESMRPELDQDTAGVPGSPNIADTIREKIDAAEIIVCDVSIVQGLDGDGETIRAVANSNVLIELGYAMRSLVATERAGERHTTRLLLVMNTAYGAIEKLPFDLRQYRPTAFHLPEGADKAEVRKGLVSKLSETIRQVLSGPSRHAAPDRPSTIDHVIESVESGAANAEMRVKRFMETLVTSIIERAPKFGGDPVADEKALREALRSTTDLVRDFARLSRSVAGMNAVGLAHVVFSALAPLLARYEIARGYEGVVRVYDYDYFKFMGHELLVTFAAVCVDDERWELLDQVLRRELFVSNGRGSASHTFDELSSPIQLLQPSSPTRFAHADLLRERHTTDELVPFPQFVDADALLFMRSDLVEPPLREGAFWRPFSTHYLSRMPRYLVQSQSATYAAKFLSAIGATTWESAMVAYAKQRPTWLAFYRNMPTPPLSNLSLEKIGTKP